ncbi:phytanoyl-CoA dioxygenase family protein [Paroceanicella profunda]|uniref:Phytanoyl-CoA dioxygenase family protein n=1 Tax=Paroceanicella profunda TaxID=2579971 RepID=A0A5B8FGP2_9RHOB|nr:phytanoyl-CoA dioxygenase family protein [Paroceanicella profunda]QDL91227.1 phytanoyl-CoA dioxygenase family protein [Paroceanicella profunda]
MKIDLLLPVKAVSWGLGVLGQEKSFIANPIIGSARLNRMGLHRTRVHMAARMAALRRARMPAVPEADRAAYDRDGFVIRENYLPPETFEAVRREAFDTPLPSWEMRQGHTVTRMTPLTLSRRHLAPASVAAVRDPALRALTGYVAGRSGEPIHFIQTVIAEPAAGDADPQTDLHADTFHSTAKFWLFLHDVNEEDGPFIFAPGSHRLTPERLEWEHRQSLTARADARAHHSFGSFRIRPSDLQALGYAAPRRMAVKANTLVVADTFGFHSRAPSGHATTRVELHGYLRRNPFVPWNEADYQALPGLRGRQLDIHLSWKDFGAERFGKPRVWQPVGARTGRDPAQI